MYDTPMHVDHGGSDILCHIRTQQTRSTEKDEDINWVRTNLRTGKNHSVEREDTLHGSYTVIPRLAARKLYEIGAKSAWNSHRIRADFPQNSSDFVKFLVTCTVYSVVASLKIEPHVGCAKSILSICKQILHLVYVL